MGLDKIFVHRRDISFSEVKEDASDIEFIRKDALLEWANKENLKFNQIGNEQDDDFARGIAAGFGYLISKLGSL